MSGTIQLSSTIPKELRKYFLNDVALIEKEREKSICKGKHLTIKDKLIKCLNCGYDWCKQCDMYMHGEPEEYFNPWKHLTLDIKDNGTIYEINRSLICHVCQGKICDNCGKLAAYQNCSDYWKSKQGHYLVRYCYQCYNKPVCTDCRECFKCQYDITRLWSRNQGKVCLYNEILSNYINITNIRSCVLSYIDMSIGTHILCNPKVNELLHFLEPIERIEK